MSVMCDSLLMATTPENYPTSSAVPCSTDEHFFLAAFSELVWFPTFAQTPLQMAVFFFFLLQKCLLPAQNQGQMDRVASM